MEGWQTGLDWNMKKRYDPIMRLPLRTQKHQLTLQDLEMIIGMACRQNRKRTADAMNNMFCKRATSFLTMLTKRTT